MSAGHLHLNTDLQESQNQLELVKTECEHWKSQWKNATETVQREKEVSDVD